MTAIDRYLVGAATAGLEAVSAADVDEARAAVAGMLEEAGTTSLAWWDGDPLVAAVVPVGIASADPTTADAGLTGAAWAPADTGALVLVYGPGRSRRTGLLPDLHIAVLAADRIVETLPDALARAIADPFAPPSAVTVIDGVSASSDIEKIRVEGVHGPRRVLVVVVQT